MHLVQLANFYSPTSGGLRTALDALREGYVAAGHDVTLVVPGPQDSDTEDRLGRRLTLKGPRLPGGYRCIARFDHLRAVLRSLDPDRIEVSDKLLALPAASVAAERDVPVTLFSHERLDGILANRIPNAHLLGAAADRWNRRLGRAVTTVVCASAYAAQEFERVGVPAVRVPLGVDLSTFHPSAGTGPTDPPTIVYAGRLSSEKRPEVVVGAARYLWELGHPLQLVMAGVGPMADTLLSQAGPLPIQLRGHVTDRAELAALLASASVAVAPCPVETFGLTVLEALACGTPVVVADRGAAPELLTPMSGRTARCTSTHVGGAIASLLEAPREETSRAARARASGFSWATTVERMLAVHGATARVAA